MVTNDHAIADRARGLLADRDLRRSFSTHAVHGDSAVLTALVHVIHGSPSNVIDGPIFRDKHRPHPNAAKPLLVQGEAGTLDHDGDRQARDLDALTVEAV